MRSTRPNAFFVLATAMAWLTGAFLVIPNLVTILAGFTPNSFVSLPSPANLSLRHFGALIDPDWLDAAQTSLVVALGTATISSILGAAAAVGMWRRSPRTAAAVRFLFLCPVIVPPVVIGLALYAPWQALQLFDTRVGLVLAHAVLALPFVTIAVSASLATVDPAIDDAARSVGASTYQRVRYVLLPSMRFGLAGGFLMAVAISWDEIVVNLFITQRSTITLPRQIYNGIRENFDPIVTAASSIITLATALLLLIRAAWLTVRARRGAPVMVA